MRFEHKNVRDVGVGGEVADHPGETDLRAAYSIINAKAQECSIDRATSSPRNAFRPIAVRQEAVNDVQIEARADRC